MAARLLPPTTSTAKPSFLIPVLCLVSIPGPACNLLQSAAIEKTCEDLPGGCSGGGDSIADTGFVHLAGVALTETRGSETWLHALGGAESLDIAVKVAQPEPLKPLGGPIAFHPSTSRFASFDLASSQLHLLPPEGPEWIFSLSGELRELVFRDDELLGVGSGGVGAIDLSQPELGPSPLSDNLMDIVGLSLLSDGSCHILDRGDLDHTPSLYLLQGHELSQVMTDILPVELAGMLQDSFTGPEDQAMVCSSAGAIYAIDDLQAGLMEPLAAPDPSTLPDSGEPLSDVVDCGWDTLSSRYLVFSPTRGVFFMQGSGQTEVRVTLSEESGYSRVAFF